MTARASLERDVVAALLAGLVAAHVLAVTTGVPLLHPEPEAVEELALFTKAVELLGLAAVLDVLSDPYPKDPFITRTDQAPSEVAAGREKVAGFQGFFSAVVAAEDAK